MPDESKFSAVGDLEPMLKEFEQVFEKHFGTGVAFGFAFTLPPDYSMAHWITNLARKNGITLFESTAARMRAEIN